MYIKKILLGIVFIGLAISAYFAYYVYNAMFVSNTNFNNDVAYIHVPTNGTYTDVREQLLPLLKNIETFDALAKQKKYTSNIKAGRYAIKKGMNNNDIINSIRRNNITVKVSFNNRSEEHTSELQSR